MSNLSFRPTFHSPYTPMGYAYPSPPATSSHAHHPGHPHRLDHSGPGHHPSSINIAHDRQLHSVIGQPLIEPKYDPRSWDEAGKIRGVHTGVGRSFERMRIDPSGEEEGGLRYPVETSSIFQPPVIGGIDYETHAQGLGGRRPDVAQSRQEGNGKSVVYYDPGVEKLHSKTITSRTQTRTRQDSGLHMNPVRLSFTCVRPATTGMPTHSGTSSSSAHATVSVTANSTPDMINSGFHTRQTWPPPTSTTTAPPTRPTGQGHPVQAYHPVVHPQTYPGNHYGRRASGHGQGRRATLPITFPFPGQSQGGPGTHATNVPRPFRVPDHRKQVAVNWQAMGVVGWDGMAKGWGVGGKGGGRGAALGSEERVQGGGLGSARLGPGSNGSMTMAVDKSGSSHNATQAPIAEHKRYQPAERRATREADPDTISMANNQPQKSRTRVYVPSSIVSTEPGVIINPQQGDGLFVEVQDWPGSKIFDAPAQDQSHTTRLHAHVPFSDKYYVPCAASKQDLLPPLSETVPYEIMQTAATARTPSPMSVLDGGDRRVLGNRPFPSVRRESLYAEDVSADVETMDTAGLGLAGGSRMSMTTHTIPAGTPFAENYSMAASYTAITCATGPPPMFRRSSAPTLMPTPVYPRPDVAPTMLHDYRRPSLNVQTGGFAHMDSSNGTVPLRMDWSGPAGSQTGLSLGDQMCPPCTGTKLSPIRDRDEVELENRLLHGQCLPGLNDVAWNPFFGANEGMLNQDVLPSGNRSFAGPVGGITPEQGLTTDHQWDSVDITPMHGVSRSFDSCLADFDQHQEVASPFSVDMLSRIGSDDSPMRASFDSDFDNIRASDEQRRTQTDLVLEHYASHGPPMPPLGVGFTETRSARPTPLSFVRRVSIASTDTLGGLGMGSIWPDFNRPKASLETICRAVIAASPLRRLTLQQLLDSIAERFPFFSRDPRGSWTVRDLTGQT